MWRERYESLKADYDRLESAHDAMAEWKADLIRRFPAMGMPVPDSIPDAPAEPAEIAPGLAPPGRAGGSQKSGEGNAEAFTAHRPGSPTVPIDDLCKSSVKDVFYAMWPLIRAQALAESPKILKILAERPELHIVIEKPVLEVNGANLAGQCGRLLADGFFREPKAGTQAQKEVLRRFSNKTPTTNLYNALDKMVAQGFLTKETDGYLAVPGMKIRTLESKT